MSVFRDTTPCMIHIDSRTLRAGRGLADLLERPTLTMGARYGLRPARSHVNGGGVVSGQGDRDVDMDRNGESSTAAVTDGAEERPLSDYLVGPALDEALAQGNEEDVDVFWPWGVEETTGGKKVKVDWRGREAILHHVFFTHFHLSPSTNFTTLLLIPPPTPSILSPPHRAEYCRIAFEVLNTPAFAILEGPAAAIYGVGALNSTGLVVNVGQKRTEIGLVVDSIVRLECGVTVNVGEDDCVEFLASLLKEDGSIPGREGEEDGRISTRSWIEEAAKEHQKTPHEVAVEVARTVIRKEGAVDVPTMSGGHVHPEAAEGEEEEEEGVLNLSKILIKDDAAKTVAQIKESAKTKKSAKEQQAAAAALAAQKAADSAAAAAAAAAALDLITVTIPSLGGKEIVVGPIRHRSCEPLVIPSEEGGRTVQEGMAMAMMGVEGIYRQQVLDGVVFCGEIAEIPSLSLAIVSYLAPYILSDEENESDSQPNRVRVLKVPDYFAHFKGQTTMLAPFLGACLAAKLIFSDNSAPSCVRKDQYNQYGPAAINLALE